MTNIVLELHICDIVTVYTARLHNAVTSTIYTQIVSARAIIHWISKLLILYLLGQR